MKIHLLNSVLVLILSLISSVSAYAEVVCEVPKDKVKIEKTRVQVFYCTDSGELLRQEFLFKSTKTPSTITYYEKNRMVKRVAYNIDYKKTTEVHFSYNDDGTYLRFQFSKAGDMSQKELYRGSPEGEKRRLKKWNFEKDEADNDRLKLAHVDFYDAEKVIYKREAYDKNDYLGIYTFIYPNDPTIFNYIDGFSAVLKDGSEVVYDYTQGVDAHSFIQSSNLINETEKARRLEILNDNTRPKVLIIDSGFDVKHRELSHKFYQNPMDKLDGLDNDGNGIVDDVVGFSIDDAELLSNNVNERLTVNVKPSPVRPFSHGTHVATTAFRGLDDYALIAVAGNMSDVELINRSSALMLKEDVLFSNMSFSFGNRNSPIAPHGKSFRALQSMINDNEKALFTVAAGNDGINLDYNYASVQYPASYKHNNILVVGALNTGVFEEAKASTYMMADFSNKGLKSVDIFAPGQSLLAGNVGDDFIAVSGTSMASPYGLNVILKMSKRAPLLTTDELKRAAMYSAYIPNIDEPFECVSGGMFFERRALKVVDVMRLKGLKAKDAALLVRGMKDYILGGESTTSAYLNKVEELWSSRMQFD